MHIYAYRDKFIFNSQLTKVSKGASPTPAWWTGTPEKVDIAGGGQRLSTFLFPGEFVLFSVKIINLSVRSTCIVMGNLHYTKSTDSMLITSKILFAETSGIMIIQIRCHA